MTLCRIVYQLIIGASSSYLLGNSVVQFSVTIGPFMYLLIILIGSLVGLEIPILTRILSDRQKDLKDSLAHVLSLDYLGALIGSIVFPLVLLPQLRLMSSSFAIGLINVLTAYITIAIFWKVLRRPKRLLALTLAGTAIMIAGVLGGQILTRFAEKQLYLDQVRFT